MNKINNIPDDKIVNFTTLSDLPKDALQNLKPLDPTDKAKKIQSLVTSAITKSTIPGVYLAACDVRLLDVDLHYQRIPKDLKKLINNFDIKKLSPLTVSYRDGNLYIIDGFHRLYVCILNGIYLIPITILMDLTQEEEAEIFATQDNGTTQLSSESKYRASLLYHEPVATAIHDVCEKYGLNPLSEDRLTKPALSGCIPIAKDSGAEGLDWIFNILYKSKWTTYPHACQHKVLAALHTAYKYTKANNTLNQAEDNLIRILSKYNLDIIEIYGKMVAENTDKRTIMRVAILNIATGDCTEATLKFAKERMKLD